MQKQDLKKRTFEFAVEGIRLCSKIPSTHGFNNVVNQLFKSSTSVGANYRAACRAKTRNDFINKLTIVEEEADETMFWLEVLEILNYTFDGKTVALKNEANEILSIIIASKKTAKANAEK